MDRIVGSIASLAQHLIAIATDVELYRPRACPHCQRAGVWRHGCYHRKADRSGLDKDDVEALPDDLADRLCARFNVTPV